MKIVICGSLAFEAHMKSTKATLEQQGYEVVVPYGRDGANTDKLVRKQLIDEYFAQIDTADAVLVYNTTKNDTAHYIGGNTLMEMTYAYAQGLDIFLYEPIPDMSYAVEVAALQPVVIDQDLAKIDEYFASLPLVYMSTESPIKQSAISRAMRRAGVPVRIGGEKVETGVNEQPMTIEETYEGAMNRHANLKKSGVEADYYVSLESGQHPAHPNHSLFGCDVIIIEKAGQAPKIGIDLDIEFPQEMLDKVPSQYPDLGVLVQQEYGSKLKDPYPHFTNGRLTRQKILENAAYNIAIQI